MTHGGIMAGARSAWPDLSRSPSIYALKVALTVVLALYVAFLFDLDHTYWALMTVPLIVRPEAGTFVWRSVARMVGTIVGGLSGLAIVLLFAQSAIHTIAATALLLFLIGYVTRMELGTDAYGYATCGFTALVIIMDSMADPMQAWPLTLSRMTETMIPIVCGFVVMLVIFPRSVTDNATGALTRARDAVRDLCTAVLDREHAPEAAPEKGVIQTIGQAHTEVRSLVFERSRKDWRRPWLANVAHELDRVAVSLTAVRFAQERVVQDDLGPARDRVQGLSARIMGDDIAPDALLDASEDARSTSLALHDAAMAKNRPTANAVAEQALADLADRLSALAVALAFLRDPAAARMRHPNPARFTPATRRYRDRLAAVQYGLRPAIMVIVISAVWLGTGWTNGQSLAMIVPALTLLLPTIIPRPVRIMAGQTLALGLLAGFCITTGLMMALAHVEGFAALALLMGATVFVIFRLCGAIHLLSFAIGSMIMIAVGLQPSNTPSLSPIRLINITFTMALLPPLFIAALTILFPENHGWLSRHLRRGTTSLLRRTAADRMPLPRLAFFDEMIDMFTDYGAGLNAEAPRDAHLLRRARAALVAGLLCDRLRNSARVLPPEHAETTVGLRRAIRRAVSGRPPDMTPFDRLRDAAIGSDDRALRICHLQAEALRPLVASGILSPRPEGPA